MRILVRKDELEKVKKMYLAIEKDTDKIDDEADKRGMKLKDKKALKKELKDTSNKAD